MVKCTALTMFRRNIIRLFRTRNLILLLFFLIFLYIVKSFQEPNENEIPHNQPRKLDRPVKMTKFEDEKPKDGVFKPASMQRIDWHNLTQIIEDSLRVGPGEQGKPAHLSADEARIEESLYAVNGFNGALSDKIPLNRSLPDIRHPGCKKMVYLSSLPTVSVVVPFHNEHWSTLLRTAYSALHRAPDQLVKEIFLVDDASTKEFLFQQLDDYLAKHMPKVKVLRLPKRSGLITARLEGAKMATGDVIVFLDSHTEANVNWLPPLLEPIALDYKTVVCPFIDVIAFDTFEYRAQDEGARGAFDWEFFYKRLPVLPKDLANMPAPFESPVMAGGLFAISRRWFWELGGYDPGLDIWGGEQYELSFKIWQCGGRMVDAPCSRVGHIYRKFAPFPNPGHGDFVGKNYRRVAEVWMDEYAEYLYKRRPHYRNIDPGDLTDQRAVRARLKCKPFKWFITQIAFDLPSHYPMVDPEPYASGHILPHQGNFCIDATGVGDNGKLKITTCDGKEDIEWVYGWHKDIRLKNRNLCWDLPDSKPHSPVLLFACHLGGGNQLWRYNLKTKQIKHSSGVCLDWDIKELTLFVTHCRHASTGSLSNYPHSQMWTWQNVNLEAFATYRDLPRVTGPLPYEENTTVARQ